MLGRFNELERTGKHLPRSQGAQEMVRLVCTKAVGGRPLNSLVRPRPSEKDPSTSSDGSYT
jgi:hypothetical protein